MAGVAAGCSAIPTLAVHIGVPLADKTYKTKLPPLGSINITSGPGLEETTSSILGLEKE